MRAGLVGDIGGTNARFAVAQLDGAEVHLTEVMTIPGARHASLEAAAREYLGHIGSVHLEGAVMACAGPVVEGAVSFTNVAWTTTERTLMAALDLPSVRLINDLAAVAWAAPALQEAGVRRVAHSGALAMPAPPLSGRGTRGILNAGTGCNASAFIQEGTTELVVVGEYGHTSLAPGDTLEVEVWRWLQARYGRVSIERVLSGPGLHNLYLALCAINDESPACASPAEVSHAAQSGTGTAAQAVARFCGILGAVAGDVALCFGARGGIYLAGGVAMQLLEEQHDTEFRRRFEDKGRFQTYLADIPTFLIQDGETALLGAARAMIALGK